MIVIGGGDSAMEDSIFISKYASELTIVHRRDEFRASKIMFERAVEQPNISLKTPFVPEEFIAGEDGKLRARAAAQRRDRRDGGDRGRRRLRRDRPHPALGGRRRGQVDTDEDGYVVTEPGSTRTNLAGVFAVGDLVDHTYRQAVTAAGTGCMGALDAEWYLRDTPPSPEAHWQKGGEPVEVAPTPGTSSRRGAARLHRGRGPLARVRFPGENRLRRNPWPRSRAPRRSG